MDVTEHKGPLPQVVQDIIDKLRSFSSDGVRTGRSGKHWGSKAPFPRREQRQACKRLDRRRQKGGGGRDAPMPDSCGPSAQRMAWFQKRKCRHSIPVTPCKGWACRWQGEDHGS